MKKIKFLILSLLLAINSYSQEINLLDTLHLNEVVIYSALPYQANNTMPVTFKNLNKTELDLKNYGQEPSRILNYTPSISTYSESGGDFGYSYIRLRGVDQTRINITLNGVSLNEPEDQGCYFSNYPDFFQSIEMLQIQRGSGMTKNGTSSFVGSMNLESYNPKMSKIGAVFNVGSFGSSKTSLNTEQVWKNGGVYLSASDIKSDGYKHHSGNISRSAFLTLNHKYKNNQFKIVGFTGEQENQLAWLGVSESNLNKDRRYNSNTEKEIDHFNQSHIQFHHTYNINRHSKINYTLSYTYLRGWFTFDTINYTNLMSDDTLTDMLMCKYNFKSNWINFSTTYSFNIDKLDLYTGFHMYGYNRKHFGNEGTFTYDNVGDKRDFSPFVKLFYKMKSVNLYCDVQYRKNEYFYLDYINYFEKLKYNFINYSIGASYNLKKGTLYYSFSKSNREPCRSDILGGVEYYIPDYANVKLKPESVYDNEFGFRINIDKINFNVNLYYMKFKNELSLNGKIGPTGVPLHENVDNSFRSGLEIDFKYIADNITITNNISYNYSRIKQGDINIRPILTPTLIFNQDINYKYDWFSLGLIGKIQSWSYIDVANKNIISDYFILNSYIGAKWGSGVEFMYYMNNITGTEYFANGVMSNTDKPLYFVGSPFNWFFALKINI